MNAEQIAHALGGKRSGRQWLARCPAHDDRSPSLIVWDGRVAPQVRCLAGCEPIDIIQALRARNVWNGGGEERLDNRAAAEEAAAVSRLGELALQTWSQGIDPRGTLAESYLWGRGLSLPADCSTLRYHPSCPRGQERSPALLAAMYPHKSCEPVAVQRVFFNDKAEKLGSMMLGPAGGAAMKLTPHAATFGGPLSSCPRLYISEGVETGLALLQLGYAPLWALGSCGAIERLPVLFGVDELVICADNDPPGLNAAKVCAERWNASPPQRAIIVRPKIAEHDFADSEFT